MSETEVKEEENTIRLGEIFHMLWKNKILIAIITAVVFLIGVIYTFWVVEPQYRSSSMVLVAVTQQSTSTGNEGAVDYTNSLRVVNTVARLVQEDVVLDPVAEEFDLSSSGLSEMISVSTRKVLSSSSRWSAATARSPWSLPTHSRGSSWRRWKWKGSSICAPI